MSEHIVVKEEKVLPNPGNTERLGGRRLAGWEEWPWESQNFLREVQRELNHNRQQVPRGMDPTKELQAIGEQVLESARTAALGSHSVCHSIVGDPGSH